jgi:hypothetical protein
MPWFKVDDHLHDHPKARKAGAEAMGLWVLAGSYAADNLTDGFVPEHTLSRWTRRGKALAQRLVAAGLWFTDTQDDEPGWRFHEWEQRQPMRAAKLAEREARAAAGRVGGQASGRSRREANTKQVASGVLEPPSRPDPTRPDPVGLTTSGQSKSVPLDDDGLTRIQELTGGTKAHARKIAELVLSRTRGEVRNPLAYIAAAIREDPEVYRYRRGNPTRAQACADHPGEWADNCRAHAIDARLEGGQQ